MKYVYFAAFNALTTGCGQLEEIKGNTWVVSSAEISSIAHVRQMEKDIGKKHNYQQVTIINYIFMRTQI